MHRKGRRWLAEACPRRESPTTGRQGSLFERVTFKQETSEQVSQRDTGSGWRAGGYKLRGSRCKGTVVREWAGLRADSEDAVQAWEASLPCSDVVSTLSH